MNRHILSFLLLLCTTFVYAQSNGISEKLIKEHVYHLASDELEGRGTNSIGYLKASEYGEQKFKEYGLTPGISKGGKVGYFQDFELSGPQADKIRGIQYSSTPTSRNVVGVVEGTDARLKDEYIVITAHLDHLGKIDGRIHNGANDNATGSAAIIEMARVIAGQPLKRSVMFVLFGAEEIGLVGSQYFVNNPPISLDKIVANLNIDGVGAYVNQPGDEIKLLAIGADAVCSELLSRLNKVNKESEQLTLATEDPANLIRRSDQYYFHLNKVPVVMFTDYGNGNYHKPTDDADKLQYPKLTRMVNMVYQLAIDLGNGGPLCR